MLSVVIPAYNEEARLGLTLEKICAFFRDKKIDGEIIVVDDGSSDNTAAVATSFKNRGLRLITLKENHGKGFAVKTGMLAAQGDLILFTDSDLSTPIHGLTEFMKHQAYDIIIGSRGLKNSKILSRQPLYREFGGKLINFLIRAIALPGIKDTQCGFKLFRREAAKKIFSLQTIDGWGFDIEILYIARKYDYKILEMPVAWSHDSRTKVRPLKDGFKILADLVRIRLNDLTELYVQKN